MNRRNEKGRPARIDDLPLEDRLASAIRRADFNKYLDSLPRDAAGNVIDRG